MAWHPRSRSPLHLSRVGNGRVKPSTVPQASFKINSRTKPPVRCWSVSSRVSAHAPCWKKERLIHAADLPVCLEERSTSAPRKMHRDAFSATRGSFEGRALCAGSVRCPTFGLAPPHDVPVSGRPRVARSSRKIITEPKYSSCPVTSEPV